MGVHTIQLGNLSGGRMVAFEGIVSTDVAMEVMTFPLDKLILQHTKKVAHI